MPRGQLGRTEFEHGLDLHVGYKRKLTQGRAAELFVDIFNVYNRQGTFRVDETYAPQYSLRQRRWRHRAEREPDLAAARTKI